MIPTNTGAKERLTQIYKITSILTKSQLVDFEEVLKIACSFLEIETGLISDVKESDFKIVDYFSFNNQSNFHKNKVLNTEDTFSWVTISEKKIIIIDNVADSPYSDHLFLKNNDVKVYIGIPLWINNEIFGSLSFFSHTYREKHFSQEDIEFVNHLSQWISNFFHKNLYKKEIECKTEQVKKLNIELEKSNKKLSENIQELKHLSQILVHDLKSPLSNIQMLSFLFEEFVTNKESEELLGIFNKSLQDVFHLITQMETLNEVENTCLKPYLELVDINSLTNEQIYSFSKTAESKQIKIQFNPAPNLDNVITDINILKRILNNLLSNAIKFSDFNKKIVVNIADEPNYILITVKDEGPGIKEIEKDKLFNRFSKLSNKPTNNESSSGLGLYIVKELLGKLNSFITVDSEPSCGSSFTINLSKKATLPY